MVNEQEQDWLAPFVKSRELNDIDAMLDAELAALDKEYGACRGRWELNALRIKFWAGEENLRTLKWMVEKVRKPEEYKEVVENDLGRNWDEDGLPRDHFRRVVRVHRDRLIDLALMENVPPVRLALLQERRKNMELCEVLYKALQRKALGMENDGESA